ncbi:hypothetical protein OIU85_002045 [Salix viminalis]|uniref:Reverse transcriptase zinc-binding domain-containing protein n=1 Tax=Salix viminalis TaxID=40686 RepID=A0A9Q0ZYF8_SALVM|nr:hypothetical protein OIU85_002045 [Salix viminalis]
MSLLDRLHNPGDSSQSCLLCNGHAESHTHLFFRCVYSAEVWREVTLRAIINWPALPWERAWEWAAKEFTNRSNPNQNLVGMILAATIYHLWAERNNRLHMQVFCSAKHTTDKTLNAIQDKIASLGDRSSHQLGIQHQWNGLLRSSRAELEALVAVLDCGWARCLFISKRLGCGWARCLLAQCVFYFGYRLGLGVSGSCLPVGVVIGLLLPVEVFKGLVLPGGLFFLWAWAEAALLASFLVSPPAFFRLVFLVGSLSLPGQPAAFPSRRHLSLYISPLNTF